MTNAERLVIEGEWWYVTLSKEYRKEVKANGDTPRARKLQSARLNAFDRYARRIGAFEREYAAQEVA
jgi:hypothetical protein